MFPVMLFFFLGILAILGALFYALRDEHAQLRVLLRAMESHLGRNSDESSNPGNDPLLHLDFSDPFQEGNNPEKELALELHFDPAEQSGSTEEKADGKNS